MCVGPVEKKAMVRWLGMLSLRLLRSDQSAISVVASVVSMRALRRMRT